MHYKSFHFMFFLMFSLSFLFYFLTRFVRLGEYDTKQNPDCIGNDGTDCASPYRDYAVEYTVYHPDYVVSIEYLYSIHDIALVRTKKTVLFEGKVKHTER